MCDEKEVWYIQENGGKGKLVGIASNNSQWFIAEEVLPSNAIKIVNSFNKKDIVAYKVRYWVQDTLESGHFEISELMSYQNALNLKRVTENSSILVDL